MSDFIFNFTEWLRSTPLVLFAIWLSNSWLSTWLTNHFFATPILQMTHMAAIAVLFSSTLMINLKILGLVGRGRTVTQMVDRFQGWIWRALIVIVISGLLLVCCDSVRNIINGIFWMKMGGLLVAALLNFWFQRSVRSKLVQSGDIAVMQNISIRVVAVALIALWCLVMVGGRWIAYAPV